MHKIGVIGDYDGICGFSAAGFDIFPVESLEQARKTLKTLAGGDYGVIFITETYMTQLEADCRQYCDSALPCVIPMPSGAPTGYGEARLKRFVEQAVGSDIIFNQ